MHKVGFLACDTTLPAADGASVERRQDAFEHDRMIAALDPPFTSHGLELTVLDWEAPLHTFDNIKLALLGTAWNYQDKPHAFLTKLTSLENRGIKVFNPPATVRWNMHKSYLRNLSQCGVQTIPTLWRDQVTRSDANEAMERFNCDRLVVKRQLGAGALDQVLITPNTFLRLDWSYSHSAMLQPFIESIAEEGELSFVFIDGAFSHAIRKQPAKGDYRIQSLYGGREDVFQPSLREIATAQEITKALPCEPPVYARIDLVRMDDGELALMEAELIEPYLYPEQGPDLGERLARAIAKRLDQ